MDDAIDKHGVMTIWSSIGDRQEVKIIPEEGKGDPVLFIVANDKKFAVRFYPHCGEKYSRK